MEGRKTIDLTSGNVWKVLLRYVLPLFGSAFVQQLYSLVDLLVVGNFAREGALAVDAIGNATVIVNLLLAFALGANGGCSVIVAKYFGKKDGKSLRETVNTAFVSFSVLCACVMAFGFGFARMALTALSVHGMYFDDCLGYLYVYMGSLPFIMFYNLGCGICSALGDSKTPFIFLVISSILNVGLDFLFVCAFRMDVAGAAWATFISQVISCALTLTVVLSKLRSVETDGKPRVFNGGILKELVVASVPIILQQSFVSVGNFFVNKCINGIDATGDATTGFTTAFKLLAMATTGLVAMSNGLTNFTSQNRAAGEYKRVVKGFYVVVCYVVGASLLFFAAYFAFPEFFTELFVQSEKLTVAAKNYSVMYLRIVSCFLPVVGVKIVADGMVRGCGGNLGFAVSTLLDLLLRVVFVYVLVGLGWGFAGVCWAWTFGWCLGMVIALIFCCLQIRKIRREERSSRLLRKNALC